MNYGQCVNAWSRGGNLSLYYVKMIRRFSKDFHAWSKSRGLQDFFNVKNTFFTCQEGEIFAGNLRNKKNIVKCSESRHALGKKKCLFANWMFPSIC